MKSSLEIGLVLCCPTEKGCIPASVRFAGTLYCHIARVGNKLWRLMFRKSKPVSLAKATLQKRRGTGKKSLSEMIHKEIVSPSTSGFPSGLEFTCRARASSTANTSSDFYESCRFADLSAWLTRFFVQSDGAVKRLLRSSKRPFFARIKSLRFARPRRRWS